ncbi:biotin/lipoyl-binding carrier protein [Bacillus alveayuensis]|uniref:biotin/lipoyl-binding carrier protein n=1 Tax=Aeribacillus alveayuensis TaxID=279215 RepID=UPI0005CD79C7|nr:biotin/lipoyl-binding carrier protein [Bacillus alveayuensis]
MMKVVSPMSGAVWKVQAEEGSCVENGDVLIILESMKMEIPITAETSGVLQKLYVSEGDFVQENDVIGEIE